MSLADHYRYNKPVLLQRLRHIRSLFWHSYTLKYDDPQFYDKLGSMSDWCYDKLGYQHIWRREYAWLKDKEFFYDVKFRFKNKEDYTLFVLSNT